MFQTSVYLLSVLHMWSCPVALLIIIVLGVLVNPVNEPCDFSANAGPLFNATSTCTERNNSLDGVNAPVVLKEAISAVPATRV